MGTSDILFCTTDGGGLNVINQLCMNYQKSALMRMDPDVLGLQDWFELEDKIEQIESLPTTSKIPPHIAEENEGLKREINELRETIEKNEKEKSEILDKKDEEIKNLSSVIESNKKGIASLKKKLQERDEIIKEKDYRMLFLVAEK